MGYSIVYKKTNHKKSKFKKWLYRFLFLILLILLLLMFHHFHLAIAAIARLTTEQGDMINTLQSKVHSLQLSNANLQIQADMMKVKINGLDIHNQIIHNVLQPQAHSVETTHNEIHTDSPLHSKSVLTPSILITTGAAVLTILKQIVTFSPAIP
jgi:cell division protein FtsB